VVSTKGQVLNEKRAYCKLYPFAIAWQIRPLKDFYFLFLFFMLGKNLVFRFSDHNGRALYYDSVIVTDRH
jgi:hypothetical protein